MTLVRLSASAHILLDSRPYGHRIDHLFYHLIELHILHVRSRGLTLTDGSSTCCINRVISSVYLESSVYAWLSRYISVSIRQFKSLLKIPKSLLYAEELQSHGSTQASCAFLYIYISSYIAKIFLRLCLPSPALNQGFYSTSEFYILYLSLVLLSSYHRGLSKDIDSLSSSF